MNRYVEELLIACKRAQRCEKVLSILKQVSENALLTWEQERLDIYYLNEDKEKIRNCVRDQVLEAIKIIEEDHE